MEHSQNWSHDLADKEGPESPKSIRESPKPGFHPSSPTLSEHNLSLSTHPILPSLAPEDPPIAASCTSVSQSQIVTSSSKPTTSLLSKTVTPEVKTSLSPELGANTDPNKLSTRNKLRKLRKEVNTQKSLNKELRNSLSSVKGCNTKLKKENIFQKSKIEKLREEVDMQNKSNQAHKREKLILTTKIESLEDTIDGLKDTIAVMETRYEEEHGHKRLVMPKALDSDHRLHEAEKKIMILEIRLKHAREEQQQKVRRAGNKLLQERANALEGYFKVIRDKGEIKKLESKLRAAKQKISKSKRNYKLLQFNYKKQVKINSELSKMPKSIPCTTPSQTSLICQSTMNKLKSLLECPVTHSKMSSPCSLPSGHTIAKSKVEELIKSGSSDPFSGEQLRGKPVPNKFAERVFEVLEEMENELLS
ncbi:unnamed protein product [Moneuplotes crassus]|uniref:U-box domain-containing protein n=1 Tax=Euplotes crassus TaxID=5936 RepID=A0AAD1UJ37_EUPCR|nr:unnamed protein product [Moneuplotes crassus]